MTLNNNSAALRYDAKAQRYICQGAWSITHISKLTTDVDNEESSARELSIDGRDITAFDTAGALALKTKLDALKNAGKEVRLIHFNKEQEALLALLDDKEEAINYTPPLVTPSPILYQIGEETTYKIREVTGFLQLIGDLTSHVLGAFTSWHRFRLPHIFSILHTSGCQALPIVALLSFLIGVVLAYQMGLQLQTYGANIFIAYLSGMAIFREFAPLITAIIVAGRTSSSFTAQIGSMKIHEEIDALEAMGLSPTELLVMPKVLGLLLVFPLLIFWADFFSLLGAMFMSKSMLDVGYSDFLARLKESVGVDQLLLGLYKAPAFAIIIALVGCYQGFAVKSSADSIGTQTTKSVVQALFLIIIADAVFSIIYSWLNL